MKTCITLELCEYDQNTKKLILKLSGTIAGPCPGKKRRLSLIFQAEQNQRYFPVFAECQEGSNDGYGIRAELEIETEHVFFEMQPECDVKLGIAFCNSDWTWEIQEFEKTLPKKWFVKQSISQSGFVKTIKKIEYIGCSLLLPIWLFDGFLAQRGVHALHPAAKGMQGKKAILYHAHGLVNDWTGYGYSVREYKTNYFKKQYEKAVRKIKATEGLLFLSERRVDAGGNMDLILKQMKEYCKNEKIPLHEFFHTQPVHQLTKAQLRECAQKAAAAKVIVLEDFYPQLHALQIRKETQILQMWHACGAFKLFGLSELGKSTTLKQSTRNHRNYTAALCSGENIVPFYSEAYGIPSDRVKPIGVPRTDVFFQKEYKENIRTKLFEKYPVLQGKRVILFAPTFRGAGNKTAYYPKERFDLNVFMRAQSQDTVLIMKNHPFVKETWTPDQQFKNRVLDLSTAENINDLLFVTSLLITDYSSVVFEASLLKLPMLFYAFDLQEYMDQRDLYFPFATFVPGKIVYTQQELIREAQNMKHMDRKAEEKYQAFCNFFLGALDGKSTERTIESIKKMLEKETSIEN